MGRRREATGGVARRFGMRLHHLPEVKNPFV
jgi:hypothetical protein